MRTGTRLGASAALVVLAVTATMDAATVSRERLGSESDVSQYSAIAVGADGVVHRVYRSGAGADTSSVLMYARGEMGAWTTELVDSREPTLRADNIVVDAEGKVHLAYYWNNREVPELPRCAVVHAVREADGWVHTTLANPNVFSNTTIAVGPDGRPHVGWMSSYDLEERQGGPAIIASYDGSAWNLVELPVNGSPSDLHVDPQGHLHVLVHSIGSNIDWDTKYFTDASGEWAEEELPLEFGGFVELAVDGDGRVHVVGFISQEGASQVIRHLVREDGSWSEDTTLADPGATFRREALQVVAGPGRQVHILFVEQRQEAWDGESDRWLVSFDGEAWTRESFATRADSAEINCAAVGPDGRLHVVCAGREGEWADYFVFGGEALDLDLSGLRVVQREDRVVVRGKLRVRNLDYRRTRDWNLRFACAERDEYLPGDEPVGRGRLVRSLRPGRRRTVPISVPISDPAAEERLLIMLDRHPGDGEVARPEVSRALRLRE